LLLRFAFPFGEGRGFYHRRVLCQPTLLTHSSPLCSSAPLRFTASRGRGFYHHRVLCQPSFVDRLFRLSNSLRVIVAVAIVTVSKSAAVRASPLHGDQQASLISSFPPIYPMPMRRVSLGGARLVPPSRRESTNFVGPVLPPQDEVLLSPWGWVSTR
jgi:hypothetical protein